MCARFENVGLQATWRILRGLSRQGRWLINWASNQSAVSQLEALDSRPQKRTRSWRRSAAVAEQIGLYLPKRLTALCPALAAAAERPGVRPEKEFLQVIWRLIGWLRRRMCSTWLS